MYFNKANNFYHGIMFHHFHDDGIHTKGQGSISQDVFYKLIKFIGRSNILDADVFFKKFKEKKLKQREVCLTFDDGIKCQIDIALPVLEDLSRDESIAKYATNLVYLTSADNRYEIESKIIYSIINNSPKRADIYWFAHVHVVDEPYTMEYRVCEFIHDDVIRIEDDTNRIDGRIDGEHKTPAVLILTAGLGNRLSNLTKEVNKALLPINNRAIISHIIEKFPKDYEIELITIFSSLGYIKNTHS